MSETLKVDFAPPFADGVPVVYSMESKPDGGDWNQFWAGGEGGLGFNKGRVSISSSWPHLQKRAALRVAASVGGGDQARRLVSSPLTVDAGVIDLRVLDKGVPHMRKMRSELAILRRKAEKNGGTDPEQLALIAEYARELEEAREARATILRRAKDYAPRRGHVAARRVALGVGRGPKPAQATPGRRELKKVLLLPLVLLLLLLLLLLL